MKSMFLLVIVFLSLRLTAQELQPTDTTVLLKVVVVNSDKQPMAGETITFVSMTDEKSYTGTTDTTGKLSVLVPKGQKYKVKYTVFDTEQDFKPLELPNGEGRMTYDYTITVTPPKTFTLNNVLFDTGKATLTKESYQELNNLAEYMTRKKTTVIEIAGHTDNVGTPASNLQLSEKRANTVRDYLLKKGIAPERVTAKGYGDTQPIAGNDTPEGKRKNRRTEVRIITQ